MKKPFRSVVLALSMVALTGGESLSLDLVLRSGDGVAPGELDPNLRILVGPANGGFGSPFTPADFEAARQGPAPTIRTRHSGWVESLSSDSLAQWVSEPTNGSVLYAHDFWLSGSCSDVTLALEYAVDNYLGELDVPGVYINGVALPGTNRVGWYNPSYEYTADIGGLLQPGRNTLFLYCYDFGAVSGLLFSARLTSEQTTSSPLDPRATFLRTSSDEGATVPFVVELASIGLAEGDSMSINRLGDFSFHGVEPGDDIATPTIAVFSTSDLLLDGSALNRVPGALPRPAGTTAATTLPTFSGGLPTDIPEDFSVYDETPVVVPVGAEFLFVCASDEFYGDNQDPDGDYAVDLVSYSDCGSAPTSVLPSVDRAPALGLSGPFPNPTRTASEVRLTLSRPAHVNAAVFDVAGRLVRKVGSFEGAEGVSVIRWDGRDGSGLSTAAGVYWLRIEADGAVVQRRVTRVR